MSISLYAINHEQALLKEQTQPTSFIEARGIPREARGILREARVRYRETRRPREAKEGLREARGSSYDNFYSYTIGWLSGGFTPCRHLRPSSGREHTIVTYSVR